MSQGRDASLQMQGRAHNYSKKLTSYRFVAVLHLLLDIVGALSKVSLTFHKDGITISRVQDKLNALTATLESFKHMPGQCLATYQAEVGNGNMFKDTQLERNAGDEQVIIAVKELAANSATSFIQKRFENMGTDPMLTATAVLTNHYDWPVGDRNLLLLHGENEVQTLCNHFRILLQRRNFILCLDEWMNLKIDVQRVRGGTWIETESILDAEIHVLSARLPKPADIN